MGALLGLPPLLSIVIVLAIAAYIVYIIISTGTVQPLEIVALALLGFGLVRSAYRLYAQRRARALGEEDD